MKRILFVFLSFFLAFNLLAQVPQGFKYQTVVRSLDGTVLSSQTVAFRISILQGSSSGSAVYVETFSVPTNQFGLASFNIGQGSAESGVFTNIDWNSGLYWVKVEIDPANGTAFSEAGTSQLLSVPYALRAKTSENGYWTKSSNDISYSSGKVGIGISVPTATLDLRGTIYANGTAPFGTFTFAESTDSHTDIHESVLTLQNASGAANSQANIKFDAGSPAHGRAIISSSHDIPGGTYNGNLFFNVRNGSTSYITALTLRSSGNVGINETSPDAKLHVNGNAHVTGNLTIDGSVAVATSPVNSTDAANKAYVDALKQRIKLLEDNSIEAGTYNLTDIDGNQYNIVKIGSQVWMKENLRVTHYPDGTPIPMVTDNSVWNALTITDRAYTFYDDNVANAKEWGGYYTWSTVTNGVSSNTNPSNVQGICPDGWHVPSDAEWQELESYLGMSASDTSLTGGSRGTDEGGKLKEAGLDHFWGPNSGATNETGFTGLPAGNRTFNSGFDNLNKYSNFWTSRRGTGTNAAARVLYYQYSTIGRYVNDNENRTGLSCRCVRDLADGTTSGGINMINSINNLSGNGVVTFGIVDGNSTGFGAALFMASDGNYEEANADGVATMPCVALALETGTGNKKVMLQGYIRNNSWTWTPGGLIFVSPTTGVLTQIKPTVTGQQVQIVGYAVKSNTLFFNPNLMLIELK
jgi:uncharacterized protein (TIGR02145 family)